MSTLRAARAWIGAAALGAAGWALGAPYEIAYEATVYDTAGWPSSPAAGSRVTGSVVIDDDPAAYELVPTPGKQSAGYAAYQLAGRGARWTLEGGMLAVASEALSVEVLDNEFGITGEPVRGDMVGISSAGQGLWASLQLRGGESALAGTAVPPPERLVAMLQGAIVVVQAGAGGTQRFSARVTALQVHRPPRAISPPAADAGAACMRDTPRQTFWHPDAHTWSSLPDTLPQHRRRELHPLIWPSNRSLRANVRDWLMREDFGCLEAVFADLESVQARFEDGTSKVVSFLGGARDLVDARRGLTPAEIEALIAAWRRAHPGSLLAEVLEVRLWTAAAWQARGGGWASEVTPEGRQAFAAFGNEARRRAARLSPAAAQHLLGRHVVLGAAMDSSATLAAKQQLALEAVRQFPGERSLTWYAAERTLPRWGGSVRDLEAFAQRLRQAAGAGDGDMAYAYVYVQVVGVEALQPYAWLDRDALRSGLLALAEAGDHASIVALQELACRWRSASLLNAARERWAAYAAQPRLEPPVTELDAGCRAWAQTLPPS